MLVGQTTSQLEELAPLATGLRADGVPVELVVPEPEPRPLHRLRPAVRRHQGALDAAAGLGSPVGAPLPAEPVVAGAGALVVMNDWGVPRELVVEAGRLGIPTAGWVEGVQDFADADTGRDRRPYRTVDLVLCLGEWDYGQLEGTERVVVGSERLLRLWERPRVAPAAELAVLNINFTYGVLEEHRSAWVRDAIGAGRRAGIEVAVSRHPADRGIVGRRIERSEPAVDLLERATVLVSRFSTLVHESLLLGVGVVYHNPHGEAVPTFARPRGAFTVTHGAAELKEALGEPARTPDVVRRDARDFLGTHLRLDGRRPLDLAVEVVAGLRAGS